MGDPVAGARSAKELLERDERLRKKIFLHAYSLTRNVADANELAQDGIARAIDPAASPWDPDEQPDLLLHVGSLMNSAMANRRRGEQRHPFSPYEVEEDLRVDPAPTAEDRLVQEDDISRLERQMHDLRARLAGDDLALAKIDLMYAHPEIDDAASQAAKLGCSVTEIRRANERIAYHAERIRRSAPDPIGPAAGKRPRPPEPAPSEREVGS
jgi:hypothetical protein